MAKLETKDIRNVVLVGHTGSGKTGLADALLLKAKAISRAVSVDDGTSIFDHEPEEKERKASIDLAMATLKVSGRDLNLLDAPGYPDFMGEAICGLNAVESAVLCVDAVDGIRVNTRKMWEQVKARPLARLIAINKMDQDNVGYAGLVNRIREVFGNECVPVILPRGSGGGLEGVVDIIQAPDDAPDDLKDLAQEAREKLMECDDALLEKYLEGTAVSSDELAKALPKALARGQVVPILCTSAQADVGLAEFLDFIATYAPSPLDVPPRTAKVVGKDEEKEVVPDGPLVGQVFKSIADPFIQRLSFIRVFSGTLAGDQPVHSHKGGKGSRMGGLFKPFGKELKKCSEGIAGDIVAVTKVDALNTGDTVCSEAAPLELPGYTFPASMVSLAVEPKSKQDLARMSEAIHKMADSDPTFTFSRDPNTAELVISGRSQLHINTILARLKRKFEVEVETQPPRLALKETIAAEAEGHHKHKKQTGGHGQYAEVKLRLKTTPRGEGFKFTDSITQGRIPQQFVPAIEKGIRKTLTSGVLAGFPVVDCEVEVYDGSYHAVDSSPAAFELAGSKAFKDAFSKAKPVMLEPVVNIEITVPAKYMGDITGDLNARRGRIQGMDSEGDTQVVRAQIPMMEIMDYETQLRSATGGEGSYSIDPSHYDILPHKIAESIIARAKKHQEDD